MCMYCALYDNENGIASDIPACAVIYDINSMEAVYGL